VVVVEFLPELEVEPEPAVELEGELVPELEPAWLVLPVLEDVDESPLSKNNAATTTKATIARIPTTRMIRRRRTARRLLSDDV
jgi:hypothetical protein